MSNQDQGKLKQAKEILKKRGWKTVDLAPLSYDKILSLAGVK